MDLHHNQCCCQNFKFIFEDEMKSQSFLLWVSQERRESSENRAREREKGVELEMTQLLRLPCQKASMDDRQNFEECALYFCFSFFFYTVKVVMILVCGKTTVEISRKREELVMRNIGCIYI